MRQGQKNNRMRGRGRKPSNPLARSYDSNGPDVKIRGTASHIAEKYQSLARDALASGDIVMAENYYQHAEHYLRIIASAQAANRDQDARQGDAPAKGRRGRPQASADMEDAPQPDVDAAGVPEVVEAELAEAAVNGKAAEDAPAVDAEDATVAAAPVEAHEEEAPAPKPRRRRAPARPRKRPAPKQENADREIASTTPIAVSMPDAPQPVVADD